MTIITTETCPASEPAPFENAPPAVRADAVLVCGREVYVRGRNPTDFTPFTTCRAPAPAAKEIP